MNTVTGVIKDSNKAYRRKVSVNPIAVHYEDEGEKPMIKWRCPVCASVGNRVSISEGIKNCSLCNVSLNWERKPEVGDYVIIRGMKYAPDFVEGDRCTVVKNYSDKPGVTPYVLKQGDKHLACDMDVFTILDEVEE